MALSGSKSKLLQQFLIDSFTAAELAQFLVESDWLDVAGAAVQAEGAEHYFFTVVQALSRRGRIGPELFAKLLKERPSHQQRIENLERELLGPASGVARQMADNVETTPGPFAPPVGSNEENLESSYLAKQSSKMEGCHKGSADQLLAEFNERLRAWARERGGDEVSGGRLILESVENLLAVARQSVLRDIHQEATVELKVIGDRISQIKARRMFRDGGRSAWEFWKDGDEMLDKAIRSLENFRNLGS